ncbi:copper resistance CopC family protein [Meiothermus sp.]|uniref:copper resistance CopC family protein n=1 Tax=Meiothermus sp. TaxID=1955249 RepID=UPI00307ED1DD
MGVVLAHAEYRSSIPTAGATLKTAPSVVTINFSQAVEVRLSTFKVYLLSAPPETWGSSTRLKRLARPLVQQVLPLRNDGSRRVDTGVTTTARTSKTVTLSLKPGLKPGAYVVMWKNLGVDGHTETDFFVFVYRPS